MTDRRESPVRVVDRPGPGVPPAQTGRGWPWWRIAVGVAVSAVAAGGALLAVGVGDDDGDGEGSLEAGPGSWEVLPAPPGADVVLAEVDGQLLALSGSVEDGFQVRRLDDGGWSDPVAVPGAGRTGAAVVATADELIVWGGRTADGPAGDGFAYVPDSRSWRSLAAAPLGPRDGPAGIWTGGEIIVLGGRTAEGETAGDAAAYDPARDAWRELPPAPELAGASIMATARTDAGAAVWAYDEVAAQASLLALDVEDEAWSELPVPPFDPPAGGAGLSAEDGDEAGLLATATAVGDPQAAALDPEHGEWAALPPPPVPTDVVCPSELHHAGSTTVLASLCSGELFVLEGTGWQSLPSPEELATSGRILVTDDEVYDLRPDGSSLRRLDLP